MRIFQQNRGRSYLSPRFNRQVNMNFQRVSIFNNNLFLNFGMNNCACHSFGNRYFLGFNKSINMPQMNYIPGFMRFFSSFFTLMMSPFTRLMNFGDLTVNTNRKQDVSETKKKQKSDKTVVSDYNRTNSDKETVTQINKSNSKLITKQENNSQKDFDKLDPVIKGQINDVAEDAMQKYLTNGKLKPQEVLPTNGRIIIKEIVISPMYYAKRGISNDFLNNDGDIVRVQDGTKLSITFEYNDKIYTMDKVADKVSEKLKPEMFIQKISKGD